MDNLQQLESSVDTAIPIGGGVGSVKTVNHNPLEKEIIKKVGRWTGFPFMSKRSPVAGVVPTGSFFWNGNAMNKSDVEFEIFISKGTADGNDIGRILNIARFGDLLHFKDYNGRSTILKYYGHSVETDTESNTYFKAIVIGFAENTNYAYIPGEEKPCMIELIKAPSAGSLNALIATYYKVGTAEEPENGFIGFENFASQAGTTFINISYFDINGVDNSFWIQEELKVGSTLYLGDMVDGSQGAKFTVTAFESLGSYYKVFVTLVTNVINFADQQDVILKMDPQGGGSSGTVSTMKEFFDYNGVDESFELGFEPTNLIQVTVNGIGLDPRTDYDLELPNIVNITYTLEEDDVVGFIYQHSVI